MRDFNHKPQNVSTAGPAAPRAVATLALSVLLFVLCLAFPALAQEEAARKEGATTPERRGETRADTSVGDRIHATVRDRCAEATVGGVTAVLGECGEDERPVKDDRPASEPAPSTPETAAPETTSYSEPTAPEDAALPESTAPESTSEETAPPEATEDVAPAEDGLGSCPADAPEGALNAEVERVIDGDTFQIDREIKGADTVRVIGADTPETKDPNAPAEPFGEEATEYAERILEGQRVALVPGKDPTDRYDRLLAYVWSEDGFFNLSLLREGYARVLSIEPNTRYERCFEAAEEAAKEAEVGLWALETASSEPAAQEEQYDGRDPDSSPEPEQAARPDGEPQQEDEEPSREPAADEEPPDETAATETPRPSVIPDEPSAEDREPEREAATDLLASDEQYDPRDPDSAPPAEEEPAAQRPESEDRPDAPAPEPEAPATEEEVALAAPILSTEEPADCPDATLVVEEFGTTGPGETPAFEVTGASFVVRAATPEDEEGATTATVKSEDGATVADYEQEQGAFDTLLSEGPGTYTVSFEAPEGDTPLSAVVYDCAGDEPAPPAPAQEEEQTSTAVDPAPSAAPAVEPQEAQETGVAILPDLSSEPPATDSAAPLAGPAGHDPAPDAPSATASATAPATAAPEVVEALPVASSPAGEEVPILPDTGGTGPAALLFVLGLACVVAAAVLAACLGVAARARSRG
jgi:micrococcal nuclease